MKKKSFCMVKLARIEMGLFKFLCFQKYIDTELEFRVMFLLKGLCFCHKFSCTNGVLLVRNYKGKVRILFFVKINS